MTSQTTAERVAVAASAYLKAEIAEARAQNELNRETERTEHSEALAEVAWTASRERNKARDALMVVMSTWERESDVA